MRNLFRLIIAFVYLISVTTAYAGFVINSFQISAPPCTTVFNASNLAPTVSTTTSTWTSASIGTASADRYVFVTAWARSTPSGTRTLSTLTIGGSGASIITQRTVGNTATAIAVLNVAAGTTATIVATWSGNIARAGFGSYSATNLQSTTAVATVSATGVDPNGTANVSAGGCTFAIANTEDNTAGTTWTGVTEQHDATAGGSEVVSGGNLDYAAASASQTFKADFVTTSGTTNLSVASMR